MNLKYFLLACKQIFIFIYAGASRVAQMVRNPPAMQGIWVQCMDWEDPLEKGMTTHSVLRPPWTEEPGSLQSMGLQRVRHD